jgi:C-terminal processing protease CtpA/Prc
MLMVRGRLDLCQHGAIDAGQPQELSVLIGSYGKAGRPYRRDEQYNNRRLTSHPHTRLSDRLSSRRLGQLGHCSKLDTIDIGSVEKGSSAERAGLKPGDVIVEIDEIDDKLVLSASSLRTRVGLVEAGNTISVPYLRQGQRSTARMTIAPAE